MKRTLTRLPILGFVDSGTFGDLPQADAKERIASVEQAIRGHAEDGHREGGKTSIAMYAHVGSQAEPAPEFGPEPAGFSAFLLCTSTTCPLLKTLGSGA